MKKRHLLGIGMSLLVVYAIYEPVWHIYVGMRSVIERILPPYMAFSPVYDGYTLLWFFTMLARILVIVIAAIAVVHAFYEKNIHKSIVLIYTIIVLEALTLGLNLSSIAKATLVSMILLYSFPYRRKFLVERLDTGGSSIKYRHDKAQTILGAGISYMMPIIIALSAAIVAGSIINFILGLRLPFPQPLPDLWMLIKNTRIGLLLVSILVIGVVVWFSNNLVESAVLAISIQPEDAASLAVEEIRDTVDMLEKGRTWHQRLIQYSFLLIAGAFIYPVVNFLVRRILLILSPGTISEIKIMGFHVLSLVDIAITILVWRIMYRQLRRMITMEGKPRFLSLPVIITIVFIAVLVLLSYTNPATMHVFLQALGVEKPMPETDVVTKLGLWDNNIIMEKIENTIRFIDKAIRLATKFLWG